MNCGRVALLEGVTVLQEGWSLQKGDYCILEGWPHKRGLTELWKGGIVRGGYCIVGGVALQEGDYCIAEGKGWFYKRGTIAL